MNHFEYRRGKLFAEDVPLAALAAAVGTPVYVYAEATLRRHVRVLHQAFAGHPHLICYAVKANPNLALLALLKSEDVGFDVVSGGELARVVKAGGSPSRTVFAGVGKTRDEMAQALRAGLMMFNVESAEELELLGQVGRELGRAAPFAIRVNPDVDARTHRHISTGHKASKFGVPFDEAAALYARARRRFPGALIARGVDCHIGSQLTQAGPVKAAVTKVAAFFQTLKAKEPGLEYLDVGGGLGITYDRETPPSLEAYARTILTAVKGTGATLVLEPGRVIVGNAGVLLTRVLFRKVTQEKTFVTVDVGMNDLLRPALYDAFHALQPLTQRAGTRVPVEVVGPICESTDVLARARPMVLPRQGELYAIMSAGAYGMSMASTYNSRPRPAEVLVSGDSYRIIRDRERTEDLWRGEAL